LYDDEKRWMALVFAGFLQVAAKDFVNHFI